MFNVTFEYLRGKVGLTVVINDKRYEHNYEFGGCRFKVSFELDGKRYFLKADDDQTLLEVKVIENCAPEDSEFFIPVLAHGSASYDYTRGDGTVETFSIYYMIQEFRPIHKPYTKLEDAWPMVAEVAEKYNLFWDLDYEFRNWAILEDTGHPVIYDAASEPGWW